MQRSKLRKAVRALPAGMPEHNIETAMRLVNNPRTRQRIEARYRRLDGAR